MATTTRKELHAALRKTLGPPAGDEMIDVLAPLERDELATHSDIARLESATRSEIQDVRHDVENLGVQVNARIDQVEARIDALDSRMEARIADMGSRILYTLVPTILGTAGVMLAAIKL